MSNISLQIERTTAGTIDPGDNVIFDSIISSTGNIIYDPLTGVITFNEAGRYSINWWVATQASQAAAAVFSLESSQGDHLEGNSPIKTGEVVGFAVLDVTVPPVTASLINASSRVFYYDEHSADAIPLIIDGLREKGFAFKTVSELLQLQGE